MFRSKSTNIRLSQENLEKQARMLLFVTEISQMLRSMYYYKIVVFGNYLTRQLLVAKIVFFFRFLRMLITKRMLKVKQSSL